MFQLVFVNIGVLLGLLVFSSLLAPLFRQNVVMVHAVTSVTLLSVCALDFAISPSGVFVKYTLVPAILSVFLILALAIMGLSSEGEQDNESMETR